MTSNKLCNIILRIWSCFISMQKDNEISWYLNVQTTFQTLDVSISYFMNPSVTVGWPVNNIENYEANRINDLSTKLNFVRISFLENRKLWQISGGWCCFIYFENKRRNEIFEFEQNNKKKMHFEYRLKDFPSFQLIGYLSVGWFEACWWSPSLFEENPECLLRTDDSCKCHLMSVDKHALVQHRL